MFLAGDEFLRTLVGLRVLWLAGRFGGGKTLLSFALSSWLYKNGYINTVYSNIPSPICEPVTDDTRFYKSALVLDEAWVLLDAREYAKNVSRTIGAFLRKYQLYLLLPSVFPVDKRFRALWCQRVFNGMTVGVPLWVYAWRCDMGVMSDKGWFALVRPQQFFGSYDTMATPTTDGGMLKAMANTTDFDPSVLESEFTGDQAAELEEREEARRQRDHTRKRGIFSFRR